MKYSLIVILTIIISGCWFKQPVGGKCVYKDFNEIGTVSDFNMDENDSLTEVNFTIENEPQTRLLRLKEKDIEQIGKGVLNSITVKDTSLRYVIEGRKIVKGSCYPYSINKITLSK